jgi:hypothetical protein
MNMIGFTTKKFLLNKIPRSLKPVTSSQHGIILPSRLDTKDNKREELSTLNILPNNILYSQQ